MDVLDPSECLVDFEHLCDRFAALRSEIVVSKAEIDEGNTKCQQKLCYRLGNAAANGHGMGLQGSYSMLVMVLLILRASAIAAPPSAPRSFLLRLKRSR